ncbi:MAG: hypothetical protein JNN15_02460 [Blastocatellia bacterium]|nr:hypothetical protein [Blastocatellia bacterium]
MALQPPDHLLVVEPAYDFQQILIHELSQQMACQVNAATIEQLKRTPSLAEGALVIATAYHVPKIKKLISSEIPIVTINLHSREEESQLLKELPVGAIVGLISVGSTVLEYAQVMIASLRGEDLLVSPSLFSDTKQWKRIARTADLVIADSYCHEEVAAKATRPVIKLQLIAPKIVRYLKTNLKKGVSQEKTCSSVELDLVDQ